MRDKVKAFYLKFALDTRKYLSFLIQNEFLLFHIFNFFLLGFPFTNIHDSQDSRERGEAISLNPLCHFHLLHRYFDISWVITADGSPLRIASSRTWTGNLWFPSSSCWPPSYASLIFLNVFFYAQLIFVFHFLRVSYIVREHILGFWFFLQKDFYTFHETLLKSFPCFFYII